MIDTFGLLQKYTGISKYSQSEVITPQNIVSDMVDLLPPEVFNPNATFFDPAVKSGRFLIEIYHHLMASDLMKQAFLNEQDRSKHILENQLYGFATSPTAAIVVRKALYNDPLAAGNIHFTSGKVTKESVQGAFNNMKFDVVIGNPPYNNDIYINFALLGKKLMKPSGYMEFITPAKWQAKGGDLNDKFRKEIVPYMSKIVFYPDCSDIFNIAEHGGICYYLIDGTVHTEKYIDNRCKLNKNLTGCQMRALGFNLGNAVNEVAIKLQNTPKLAMKYNANDKYKLDVSKIISFGGGKKQQTLLLSNGGSLQVLGLSHINETEDYTDTSYDTLYTSNSKDELNSIVSYIYTKLVRFLVMGCITGHGDMMKGQSWRFVPDPGSWDCIYEDAPLPGYTPDRTTGVYLDAEGKKHCSLYVKYNLAPDEIKVIESVIKSRK